jgi:hypothetical protein
LCNCVWLRWLCVILWFTLTLNFWYIKLKTASFIFLRMEADFFILCYLARYLQHIHWSKLLCGMYGLTAKSSVSRLNICQILMRFTNIKKHTKYQSIMLPWKQLDDCQRTAGQLPNNCWITTWQPDIWWPPEIARNS